MPFSDALINTVVSQHTQESTGSTSTASTCVTADSSSTSESSRGQTADTARDRRMTSGERKLLATLRAKDAVMRQAIVDQQWDNAAIRWNTFVRQCRERAGDVVVKRVNGDLIKQAVSALDAEDKRRQEHGWVRQAQQRAMQEIEVVTPYVAVSPLMQKFSQFEDAFLRQTVPTCRRGEGQVNWKRAANVWKLMYYAQVESNAVVRLTPRDDEMLRSRWMGVLRKRQRAANPAVEEQKDEQEEAVEEQKDEQQDDRSHSDNGDDDGDDDGDDGGKAEAVDIPALPTTADTIASRFGNTIHRWLHPQAPTSPSSSSAPSSSSSSSAAAAPPTTVAQSRDWHWDKQATAHFRKLAVDCNWVWTYETFCALWPAEVYGYVDHNRFKNKCRIEKQWTETGSRVKDPSKRDRSTASNRDRSSPSKRRKQ
jgi:hypothetical protein